MPVDRPRPDEVVLRADAALDRRRDLQLVGIFVVAALPVAALLWLVVGPVVAVAYVVVQTAVFTFGARRRHRPVLRLSPSGLSYEPGQFQLRCPWSAVAGVEAVDHPSGATESFVLDGPHLHWAVDNATRERVRQRGWDRAIPVADFEPRWRQGRIGEAARRFAPHLLEE